MYGTSADAILSLLRQILMFLGGFLVYKGYISADVSAQLVGALVTIVGSLFSIFFHATSNGSIAVLSTTSNAAKPAPSVHVDVTNPAQSS